MSYPTIAIIIPVLNEEYYLPKLLENIASQTIMPDQVIVVDAVSIDGTSSIAQSCDFVTYLVSSEAGVAQQRNYGALKTSCDICVFCDCDTVMPFNFIENVKKAYQRNKNTSKSFFPIYMSYERDFFVTLLFSFQTIYFWLVQWFSPIMAGPMMIIPKQLVIKVGGFDSTKLFEDVYMASRVGKFAPVRMLPAVVRTSRRRFVSDGYITTTILYLVVSLLALVDIHFGKKYFSIKFGHHEKLK